MTLYFRLLAGFTSFISKRCLSHFCSIGPAGTLGVHVLSGGGIILGSSRRCTVASGPRPLMPVSVFLIA